MGGQEEVSTKLAALATCISAVELQHLDKTLEPE